VDPAHRLQADVRQLLLQASIKHSDITMELAKEIVNRTGINRPSKKVTPEDITTVVANYFVVEVDKIIEQGRGTKEVAQARQLAMFLMKELTSASLKTIGQRFGGHDVAQPGRHQAGQCWRVGTSAGCARAQAVFRRRHEVRQIAGAPHAQGSHPADRFEIPADHRQ